MFTTFACAICLGITLLYPQLSLADITTIKGPRTTKDVVQGLGFLQKFTLPAPDFTYNVSDEAINAADVSNLKGLIEEMKYFMDDAFDESYWFDPYWEYCPTNYSADLSNNDTCVNATYISPRYDLASYLSLYLPRDACATISPPNDTQIPDCSDWTDSFLATVNKTHDVRSALHDQTQIATKNETISKFRIIGDYLGVGFSVKDDCKNNVNMVLNGASEFDKAASAAAVTLMALVPTLLTLGNLFVPRSSEVFATSFLVGIMSAMFSLGLPVNSISGIDSSQSVNVDAFEYRARRDIARLGHQTQKSTKVGFERSPRDVKISELQRWSSDAGEGEDDLTKEQIRSDCAFSQLRSSIQDGWSDRAHCWHIPSIFIAGAQVALFLLAIGPLFLSYGTPLLLFDCANHWTSAWLLIAAIVSAVFRLTMWEAGVHERVKAYALSQQSENVFRRFVEVNGSTHSNLGHIGHSTEYELPPLYPPLLETISAKMKWRKRGRDTATQMANTDHRARIPMIGLARHYFVLARDTLVNHLRAPKTFFKSGVSRTETPNAARRWRPLIILMHLSTEGRNPLVTLFTGLVQGIVLILLTAFFGAQWGANLFILLYTTTVLLVAVTIGRMLGLFYVTQSSRTWGLHVFETKDHDQMRGCLRIICSMERILVNVNGAWYFEGHRLDRRDGWHKLQQCYNLGHLDDADSHTRCDCDHDCCLELEPRKAFFPESSESLGIGKALPYSCVGNISLRSSKYSIMTSPEYDRSTKSIICTTSQVDNV